MARQVQGDLDIQGALLLGGDPGVAGQTPRSQGPSLPAVWTDASGVNHYQSDTRPVSPSLNDTWTDTSKTSLPTYRYISDGTSSQWVQLGLQAVSAISSGDPTFIQATAPTVEQLNGASTYAWWQTIGDEVTLWIEDGT